MQGYLVASVVYDAVLADDESDLAEWYLVGLVSGLFVVLPVTMTRLGLVPGFRLVLTLLLRVHCY